MHTGWFCLSRRFQKKVVKEKLGQNRAKKCKKKISAVSVYCIIQKYRREPCLYLTAVCSITNRSKTPEKTLSLSDQEKGLYHYDSIIQNIHQICIKGMNILMVDVCESPLAFFAVSIARFFSISGENSNGTCILKI